MKLLYLVTRPRPFFNNQVKSLRDKGHRIDILEVPGRESQEDTRSAIDYFRYYPKVLSQVRNEYDIIHANFGNTVPFAVFQPRRPLVVTYWGTDLNGRTGSIAKFFGKFANQVILPSPVMADKYDGDHVVIPFGIETELFKPINQEDARRRIGWDLDSNIALFPYTPKRPEKNFDIAKDVINDASNEVDLKVIHDIEYQNVPFYMNASDLVLITSKEESGPMVVKEAMACNVPVLSTDVGFVEEVIEGVSSTHICDSIEQFSSHVDDIVENDKRSDGRKKATQWSIESMGNKIETVYNSLI